MSRYKYKSSKTLMKKERAFNDRAWSQEDQDRGMEVVDWGEYHHFVTVEEDGHTAGVLSVDFKAGVGRITEVIVGKDFRGKGLGKGLMLECEKLANDNGVHKLWLETRREYKAAYEMYEKLGYVVENEIRNYFNHLDYLIMSKELQPVRGD